MYASTHTRGLLAACSIPLVQPILAADFLKGAGPSRVWQMAFCAVERSGLGAVAVGLDYTRAHYMLHALHVGLDDMRAHFQSTSVATFMCMLVANTTCVVSPMNGVGGRRGALLGGREPSSRVIFRGQ